MNARSVIFILIAFCGLNEAAAQWAVAGNNIYNTNTGNVGIGNNTPSTLLYVAKNMTEPTITVRNLNGFGGATYSMIDDASGANWKFKATLSGGFKIRDHSNSLDVVTIEPNSIANALYIKSTGIGVGTDTPKPSALLDVSSTSKGFLPPRMTGAQMNSIAGAVDGLLVFCTDCGSGGSGTLCIFLAGIWYNLAVSGCSSIPAAPVEGTHVVLSTQIVWNWNTVPGAAGYKWNTTDDYLTAQDMGSSTSKTETGLSPGTDYLRYAWAYNTCGHSTSTALTATTAASWLCGDPVDINHVAGAVAPVSKSVSYGTVNNIPGAFSKCWITSNLGADHQATAVNDATEPSAGWYWQFNRQQGYKHDGINRTPNTTWITSIDENSDWLTSNDPCAIELSSGWRLPTHSELYNIDNDGGWTDWNGPWSSALKMHAAGFLDYTSGGNLATRGGWGFYWSSTQANNVSAYVLHFSINSSFTTNPYKANGYSIRCLKD
ncbi:MAG: hypothetical protein MUC31_04065 [Bacteroidales bacterium]|jgi:hypothetical protein|nr:hypothetical protein [Bacteroidales bacterium]